MFFSSTVSAETLCFTTYLCVPFIQGHLVTLPNSQEPWELGKKNNRTRQPWYIPAPGPKTALAHVPPIPGIRKSWAWLHKGCVGPTLEEPFLYILSEMQQTTGYFIKAAQAMKQRRGESLEKNTLLLHRVWKYLVPYKYRGSLEDDISTCISEGGPHFIQGCQFYKWQELACK